MTRLGARARLAEVGALAAKHGAARPGRGSHADTLNTLNTTHSAAY